MTDEESIIDNLKYLISDDCTDTQHDFVEEIEVAIKALEKQIPKKPSVSEDQPVRYVITYKCPDCGGKFTGTVSNYCYHCGQALDWSEENA